MSVPANEFSRIVRLDTLGRSDKPVTITADEGERTSLARRFNLTALDRLEADYVLAREDGKLIARGTIRAALSQPCVATGEPVPESIDAPFMILFEREGESAQDEEEIELDEEDCDVIFFTGESIDMGEAVAQTLSLSMNPYPRSPDADAYLKKMGVISEEEAGPFAKLLQLKGKAEGKE